MSLFSFRLKDGNTVIIYAQDEPSAREVLREMGQQDTVATVREIKNFAARFALTDSGDLQTTLLHPGTLNEMAADYPFLQAAKSHSFVDFGSPCTDDPSNPVLFSESARQHIKGWDKRDVDVIAYAVQQERERFSN